MEGLSLIPGRVLRGPIECEEIDVSTLPLAPAQQPSPVPQTIPTAYGEIPVERLITAFNATQRHAERKREWLQTDEGKAYNRQRAKTYYENNKGIVLEKRARNYEVKKTEINNRSKTYYLEHREEILERNKQRREARRRLEAMGNFPQQE